MASQQALFAETIAGLRRAVKRRAEDWDSESSIERLTNRGNKLRKTARFVREGQLAPPTGPRAYKLQVEHAGHRRDVLSKKHPLVDDEGYEIDSEDDDDKFQAAALEAAESDPYSGVRLDYLLAPLTAATDLPHHPTLSQPFTSKTLTELTCHAGEVLQKERASLWRVKHLLTKLSGDDTWIPCGAVESENDISHFANELDQCLEFVVSKQFFGANYQAVSEEQAKSAPEPTPSSEIQTGTCIANGGSMKGLVAEPQDELAKAETSVTSMDTWEDQAMKDGSSSNGVDGNPKPVGTGQKDIAMTLDPPNPSGDSSQREAPLAGGDEGEDVSALTEDFEETPVPRRMRTRAQAQAASDKVRPASPESDEDLLVHPFFSAPKASHPDRDMGLPQHEAEETRRLLQLYVQKQEEICRSAQKVYEGLLRADRLRRTVMKWAKAEAHVGVNRDMSDGEDWYDKEEWGLEEDLKKGQDEDEEDATTTAKKTTRARRQ